MSNHISLKDFLKKYTAISNKFIDEYYKFYEDTEKDNFGIKIQDVMTYLNIKNHKKLAERLRNDFIIKKDYIIIRLSEKLVKNKKDVQYMLSIEGFEKICMVSNTEKGKMFRDYFIMLRKFIDYYKDHFANKINELAKEDNKYIYILMVNKDKDILKLGRANHMRNRLKSYATGKETHPDVKFIMIVDDAIKVEKCTKLFVKKFQYKGNKELYKMDIDDLKKSIFGCAQIEDMMDKSIQDKMNKNINNTAKYDTYIVYDDSKKIEYLNLNGDVIGYDEKYEKGYDKKKSKTLKTIKQSMKKNKKTKLKI